MDQRRQEEYILKQQCRHCKRRNVALMRGLCLISLVLTGLALTLVFGMYSVYPPAVREVLSQAGLVGNEWLLAGVFGFLCFLFAVAWGQGSARYRKSQTYLDYKTLKNTLKAEKLATGR